VYEPEPDDDRDDDEDDWDEPARPEPSPDEKRRARITALAQLVTAFVAFFAARVGLELLGAFEAIRARWPAWEIPAHVFIQGAVAIAVVALILRVSREPWRSVGAGRPDPWWLAIARGLSTVAVIYVLMVPLMLAVMLLVRGPQQAHMARQKTEALSQFVKIPLVALLPSAVMAGLYEELFVRGLLQSRIARVISGHDQHRALARYGAVCLGAALFGAAHWYQGPAGVLQTTVVGVILGGISAHWRSIWPAVIAHSVIDTIGLLVSRVLVPAAQGILQRN
jgi:membrane protease YdiL (CAAX protease family)